MQNSAPNRYRTIYQNWTQASSSASLINFIRLKLESTFLDHSGNKSDINNTTMKKNLENFCMLATYTVHF